MNGFFGKFHIGSYYLHKNARTDEGVKDLKHCGIDLVIGMDNDRPALDLFAKYGVSAVVTGIVPGWFGGNGENAGTMAKLNKTEAYKEGIKGFADHPAIVGIDVGDEPSSLDFGYYGEVIELIKELAPAKLSYLNLYPSYGMTAASSMKQVMRELGTADYREYIEKYVKNVDLPYISLDHYFLTTSKSRLLSDLATVAACCKEYKKKLLFIGQVNSLDPNRYVTEPELALQAFCAMAYGAKMISWACYTGGWWSNNVLDEDGNKTVQYEKLKRINKRVRALADGCFEYDWVEAERSDRAVSHGVFKDITVNNGAVIGKFEKGGREALIISPADCGKEEYEVTFTADCDEIYLNKCSEKERLFSENGRYKVTFKNTEACFLTAE